MRQKQEDAMTITNVMTMTNDVCDMGFVKLLDFSSVDNIYMLVVLARTKNNDELTKKDRVLFREPVHSLEELPHALAKMRALAIYSGLNTYMYVSTNARSAIKTYKEFKMMLAKYDSQAMLGDEGFKRPIARLDKVWYQMLMQPESKSSRYFVLDIDTKDEVTMDIVREKVNNYKVKVKGRLYKAEVLLEQPTRNGYHFVTTPFDPAILAGIRDVGISKDGLLYLTCFGFDKKSD
jgi:hypothetical protein